MEDEQKPKPIKLRHAPARPKNRKENPYYVGTKELKAELQKYFDSGSCPEERIISRELGEMLIKISTRYASKPCFSGYYYKSEFISEAIYKMVQQLSKINLAHPRCNPFSYLTCICYCVFISTIKRHNKNAERLRELRNRVYEEFCLSEGIVMRKELDELLSNGDLDKELYDEIVNSTDFNDKEKDKK